MSLDAPKSAAPINGSALSIGIVAARFNPELADALVHQVRTFLLASGVKAARIHLVRVPGSHELPVAVQLLLRARRLDAVVALGVIIRGDTIHYELVAEAATQGLLRVALDTRVPVIAGVIAAENLRQAEDRCRGKIDRGAEFALAALEMAALKKKLSR